MSYALIPADKVDDVIEISKDVAVCPYCEATVTVTPEGWSQNEDGSWSLDNGHADCAAEPDMEDDEEAWEEWLAQHSVEPYSIQLPVDLKVTAWINEHFRFEIDVPEGAD